MSRTQILLTKITQICQEIRDIRRSKINNIQTKLPEFSQHHIHIPESSGNYGRDDRDGVYYQNNPITRRTDLAVQTNVLYMDSPTLQRHPPQFCLHQLVPLLQPQLLNT